MLTCTRRRWVFPVHSAKEWSPSYSALLNLKRVFKIIYVDIYNYTCQIWNKRSLHNNPWKGAMENSVENSGRGQEVVRRGKLPDQCEVTETQPPTLQTGGLFSLVVWKKIYKGWSEFFLACRINNRLGEVSLALSIEKGWKRKANILQRHTENCIKW